MTPREGPIRTAGESPEPRSTAGDLPREFRLIRAIWKRLGAAAAAPGDDCALVTVAGTPLAITTDVAVEGTHFRLGWMTHADIGYRATAGSLSDLAAVAAEPAGVMVSLGVSDEWPDEFIVDLMEGVGAAARAAGAEVWGGDLVRSERTVVDVVCIGSAPTPVRRAGARPGDGVWVTGRLGAPHAAIRALHAGREPDAGARARLVRPEPRVLPAGWLRERGATAMIDVSDGLLADAAQLALASAVGISIEAERVPVHPAADAPDDALVGGEEYELLLTMPEDASRELAQAFAARFDLALTRVGRVDAEAGVRLLRDGEAVAPPVGWTHFG